MLSVLAFLMQTVRGRAAPRTACSKNVVARFNRKIARSAIPTGRPNAMFIPTRTNPTSNSHADVTHGDPIITPISIVWHGKGLALGCGYATLRRSKHRLQGRSALLFCLCEARSNPAFELKLYWAFGARRSALSVKGLPRRCTPRKDTRAVFIC